MNILLIYPKAPGVFWSMKHAMKLIGKKTVYPPLSLLTIAAMLPSDWHKRLVDLNVQSLGENELIWADYVFLSGMYIHRTSMEDIIEKCNLAGVKVVGGGPFLTHEYENISGVDHFILNEAEITLPPFLSDLEAGCPKPVYTSSEFADVSQTPIPMWDLVNLDYYAEGLIQYSRGCPYQCDFCDVTSLFGRLPRTKTPEQVIAELESMGDLKKFRAIFFADDNLIGNKKHLKTTLLPALIEWRKTNGVTIPFRTQVTINLADDQELMDLMIEAGFKGVFIGIETPSVDSLIACKKKQNTKRDLIENVKHLQRSGFDIYAGFIVGFDTDTASIFQQQAEFIQESGIVVALVNILKAPPGTELRERMAREGRLFEGERNDISGSEGEIDFTPMMGEETLYRGFKEVVRYIYKPTHLYKRVLTFLTRYRAPEEVHLSGQSLLDDVGPFLKSVYYLGIIDSGRFYYWKLVLWTLLKRPKLFQLAMELWIVAYHYRKIYEDDPSFVLEEQYHEAQPSPLIDEEKILTPV